MKNISKIMIVLGVLLIAFYGFMVYRVNANARKTEYKYYEKGEICDYKGFEIEVVDSKLMKMTDFREEYQLDKNEYNGASSDEEMQMCLVWLKYTRLKEGEDELCQGPGCFEFEFTNDYWYGGCIDGELFEKFNEGTNHYITKVGESVTYVMMIPLQKIHFNKHDWEHVWEEPIYMYLLDYEGKEYISMMRIN